jgi:ferredoxin
MGPIFGNPVKMGLIIASKDMVAADAVGGRIIGYEPKDVPITVCAAARGFGEMDLGKIEVRGIPIAEVERRFMRSSETRIEGTPPFELLFDEGTCTGCRNTVIGAIMDMKTQNLESYLKDKCIVCGPIGVSKIPNLPKEQVILVGICTKSLSERGIFVQGCPPNNIYMIRAVAGEDVKNRY